MKRFSPVNCGLFSAHTPRSFNHFNCLHITTSNKISIIKNGLLSLIFLFITTYSLAQTDSVQKQNEYKKVVTERVKKIVNTLDITDSATYYKAVSEIVNQYTSVNAIHEESAQAITAIKAKALSKEETNAASKEADDKKIARLTQQHTVFISHLNQMLTADQVEKVKNGMTYSVFPITYVAYQDMIPRLTDEQKQKIYDWLKEARELAMDAESADKKHAVFGKYKGRINNYLSAQGYDAQKERTDWEARIKAKKEAGKSSN